jgi:phosphatidylethanolamine/phosphatidyl-N-methylethanolamine N-methyltransferase
MSLKVFAVEAITAFHTTAAIAPSSRYLTRAMLEPLPWGRMRTVVELGPGTGAMTQALLDRLPGDAVLFAFEINIHFFDYLKRNIPDPRLVLLNSSAEMLSQELSHRGCNRVDAVVSSLGLGLMSDLQRHALLGGLVPLLGDSGVFTQYQYIHGLQLSNRRLSRLDTSELLCGYFGSIQRKTIWRNLPPAFVFTCCR